ncbi:zinc-binding dehydrogenase [Gordonia desulfuricans]|uniref:zinc-binding dehydrogenase n=1 Tax=Gordonia desulfuricans TaxID=89051 RepID=UPI000AF6EA9D|nr:zinc-binding dehydrogenase [Gordonia desulfuricans]
MRALIGGKGPDWVLEDIAPPEQLGALRIRVMAAGVNRADLYALEGTYTANSQGDGPFTAGMEVAGVVENGSLLSPDLPAGTPVMGITVGAFVDAAICDPRLVVPIPHGLDFTEAASLPVGLITEHDALVTQAGFTAGDSVLIVGATSSIGLIGVQMAKALGASTVIATTTTDAKRQALVDAGADVTVNTRTEDLAEVVLAATDGAGATITLDHVGGSLFAALPAATAIGGTIVSIGRLAGTGTELDLDTVAFRRQRLLGTTFSIRTRAELAAVVGALTAHVLPAVESRAISPRLDRVFDADDALAAAQHLRSGQGVGKVVFDFSAAHTTPDPAPDPVANIFGGIAQIGYVVRDVEASMRGFLATGVGPWFYLKGVRPQNFTYRGERADMAMDVAIANSGGVQIELICPVGDAPSMYRDFLAAGNEGVQHLAYWTEDYQGLYDRALAAGFTVGQEGQIGGADGRFAYFETEHHPGTVVEISDVGGTKRFVFDLVKLAADNWDWSNPIQEIDASLIGGDPAALAEIMAALG